MNWAVEAREARAGELDVVRIETGYETTAASMREYLAKSFPVELAATREGRGEVVVHADAGVGRTLDQLIARVQECIERAADGPATIRYSGRAYVVDSIQGK
jgi:hypothetical protein